MHNWPLIPIHAVLLPDGRVLTYGSNGQGQATGFFIYDVWDPANGASNNHLTLPNGTGTDTFCNAQLLLPNGGGDTVMAGGDVWNGTSITKTGNDNSVLFRARDNSLTRGGNMHRPRWYASMTTLVNGEILVQGGLGGGDRAEVRTANGTFRLLTNADTSIYNWYYPRNFVAPDGRVFGFESSGYMYYLDPSGAGAAVDAGRLPQENRGSDASAAMFAPGRILQFGGNSSGAVVIDITGGGAPAVTPTETMSTHRRIPNATVLADGTVLATGGSRVWNELIDVSLQAEIWNPTSGTWTVGASGAVPRLYHSIAILMPDASVLVGGGGSDGPLTNLNVETYYPPYLFASGGRLAPRPRIVAAPATLIVGQDFTVDFGNAAGIARVALVKSGSVTHGWNMDQRYVPLAFSAEGTRLTVQMPASAAETPPGYYLLFVISGTGVPSVARVVRVP